MNAVSIGPFAFSSDRLSAIVGIVTFLIVTSVLASRADRHLTHWSTAALFVGLLCARIGHVLMHLENFVEEPWRVLAFWQGGFSWIGGAIGVVLTMVFLARESKTTLPWAAVSLAAGTFAWLVTSQLLGGQVGPMAPTQKFAQLTGDPVAIADRAGRPIVVNLWATWCPPCRREMPMMALAAQLNPETAFVFANQGEATSAIKAYLQKEDIALDTVVVDQFSALSRHYSAPGLPATLFIDADGRLVTSHLGEISKEVLAENIKRITKKTTNEETPL